MSTLPTYCCSYLPLLCQGCHCSNPNPCQKYSWDKVNERGFSPNFTSFSLVVHGSSFFFFISKSRISIEKRTSTKLPKSTQEEYKREEHHLSHLYPNQVKKPTKELKLSSLNILAQDHKVNKKEDFILKAEGISLSKAALFLSFHTVQNKQRGAANYKLFRFLPTLALCHARSVWLTVNGNAHL